MLSAREQVTGSSSVAVASEEDVWLACHDARRDVNADEKGISNSHKLMEYLATGKVVVSNLFTMYLRSSGTVGDVAVCIK